MIGLLGGSHRSNAGGDSLREHSEADITHGERAFTAHLKPVGIASGNT
jgi:hypothetical protein